MKKKSLTWLVLFFSTVMLLVVALGAFNVITDPFGAFGDRFFQWWSYDETNNPRVAKFSYLEQNHEKYDSYIIGCSSTSSFPTEDLNRYYNASFYNLIMYGADMLDVEQMSRYLVEHYTVKNLVVNVYIDNGTTYDEESNHLTHGMPCAVSGENPVSYYLPFLLADPSYGLDKLSKIREDGYLQEAYDVFNPETGAYDKSSRDVEYIGSREEYLQNFPVFSDYKTSFRGLYKIQPTMQSLAAIRALCAEHDVRLTVVTAPIYYEYLQSFDREQVEDFYTSLAQVTPFWDFSVSSVSREPRFFYDGTHFRNCVGTMALAKMFGDDSVYIPEDFGTYVTPETVKEHVAGFWDIPPAQEDNYSVRVPVLLYHHVAEEGRGLDTISAARFEEHMAALEAAGYHAVTFRDLQNYVTRGENLPENPVVITFDDGYESNTDLALPILQKHSMNATVFVIGVSVGKDTYKDTGVSMLPHFSMEQGAAAEKSGVLQIESHGYDIHQVEGRDPAPIRQGILQREDESEEEYIAFLRKDCAEENRVLTEGVQHKANVLAYPYGKYDKLTEVLLAEEGIYATLTIEPGTNTLIKGMPQTLRAMRRSYAAEDMTGQEVLQLLQSLQ